MLNILQSSRALAAIFVAAFHLSITMGATRYGGIPAFQEYTKHGHLGVDFFFVISGFIILFAHAKDIDRPDRWSHYAFRRFARLYPVYWLYTTVFVVLLAAGFGTDAKLPEGIAAWINTYTLVRFSPDSPPIGPAWTLFHELAFYAIFSLLLLNKKLGVFCLVLWGIICAAVYHYPGTDNRTAYIVYTSAYSLYFLFGMGAYYIYKQKGKGLVETFTGFTLILFWFILLDTSFQLPKIVLPAGFALLLGGATKMESNGLIKSPAFATFIGNASYSIYLTHEALEGLTLKIFGKLHLPQIIGANGVFIVTLTATIGLGCLAYQVCEKPLIAWVRKLRSPIKAVSA